VTAARALVLATAVFARVCWKMQTNYEEELRRMGEDRDIERREDTAGCYTCGAAVGSEHVSGCPRAAQRT
jgi:hypothetical protein